MIAIGIDTGSTSTDAVAYDIAPRTILACAKAVTTHEHLETGIRSALRGLPPELLRRAAYLSLSTTLATNACVERKGEKVCLLFIGASRTAVEWTLDSYGFESMDFIRFIDGDPSKHIPPDWAALDAMLPEIKARYGGVAVAQIAARENDGLYEQQARERIERLSGLPVTCSYEIFRELNVIKRGAGALLNARMGPVIAAFFDAVHRVLDEDGFHDLPVFVMRSDGSMVSEEYTLRYPVETLVCGPTASVMGAMELFPDAKNAVVVDMGGTTSDLAIVKNGKPKIDTEGVNLAGWQTFVRGVSIETLGLGGDSRVRCGKRKILLDSRRAMPLSILAARFPGVLKALEATAEGGGSFLPLHEHALLIREDWRAERHRLSETEGQVCAALEGGPLSLSQLAKALGADEYSERTESLERRGFVLRCGFTPTDAILLRGDVGDESQGAYGRLLAAPEAKAAAEYALRFLEKASGMTGEEILEAVYRQIKEKLFRVIVEMLWNDRYTRGRHTKLPEGMALLTEQAFAAAWSDERFFRPVFATEALLLGSGAPARIFLPDVARALGTEARLSPYSGVANALGAMLGDVCVYETVSVRAEGLSEEPDGKRFFIYGEQKEGFPTQEEAVAAAIVQAERRAARRAEVCGAKTLKSVTHEVRSRQAVTAYGVVPLGADVTACAHGALI